MRTVFSGEVGQRWQFNYVNSNPTIVRDGTIEAIRDTRIHPIRHSRSCIFRSQFLVTMKMDDGKIKAFYADQLMQNAVRIS